MVSILDLLPPTLFPFELSKQEKMRPHLSVVHDAPVCVQPRDLAARVHALRVSRGVQPEALCPAQQAVQVVVEVVVQAGRGAWVSGLGAAGERVLVQ